MIPKNIRRTITVNNILYEYCVTGCVCVFIRNMITNEKINWYQEWKDKWQQSITPKDIRTLIETKSLHDQKVVIGS